MTRRVALFRGINVGTAKAVQMADLRALMEARLGFTDVATVLRSGNLVFSPAENDVRGDLELAAAVEAVVGDQLGVQSSVLVLGREEFLAIAGADPLGSVATDGSRTIITFMQGAVPPDLDIPRDELLAPEILRVRARAVYQWLPDGVLATKVPPAFWKQFDAPVTARNRNTVEKLAALLA